MTMNNSRDNIKDTQRWVIKIGSALMTDNGLGLRQDVVQNWADQIHHLKSTGHEVVLVSSGAVAEGLSRLNWQERPKALSQLQAAAAIGQMGLIQAWETSFREHGIHTAQILVTREDIDDRQRYLNARSTLKELLKLGVIPIVNENDTVSTEEIRFGDNDRLAGLVCHLIDAQMLLLLTDQHGLFTADPRKNPDATLLHSVRANDDSLIEYAGAGGALGRGGMVSKLKAARIAATSGANTIIAHGLEPSVLTRLYAGEEIGTYFQADQETLAAKKLWLSGLSSVAGCLILDDGAVNVLKNQGKSLLSVGVTDVVGQFERGDFVACTDSQGNEIARGLVNYNSDASLKIKGQASQRFQDLLGYMDEPELIHRDNLILLK